MYMMHEDAMTSEQIKIPLFSHDESFEESYRDKENPYEVIVMRFLSRSADFGIYGAVIVKFGTKTSLRKL